jgi:hypothetical protein
MPFKAPPPRLLHCCRRQPKTPSVRTTTSSVAGPQLGRRVPTRRDIIVIPHRERFPYGHDIAATGCVGTARASVRGRAGHFAQWPLGRSAARVSGREEAWSSSRSAAASARAGHSTTSESRTRAAASMRPRRVAGQRCESNGGPQLLIIIKSTTYEESIQAVQ